MNDYLSKKLKTLSFIAMIMVVFIHSYNYSLYLKSDFKINPIYLAIEDFISFHLCRIAVPGFFMLSAYLLLFEYQLTVASYFKKIKKRFQSLVIPYLLWCSLWAAVFIVISYIPQLKAYINNPIGLTSSFGHLLLSVYMHPVCYQFWFIRDLIVLIGISPVLYYLIQKTGIIVIGFAYLYLLFSPFELEVLHNSSLLYFLIGMAIHLHKISAIPFILKSNTIVLGLLWLGISYLPKFPIYPCAPIDFAAPIAILTGVVFVWKVYDCCKKDTFLFKHIEKNASYSFFLFGIHEPLLISLKKIGFALIGFSNEARLLVYFVLPFLVYCIAINTAVYCSLKFNPLYKLFVGGRT